MVQDGHGQGPADDLTTYRLPSDPPPVADTLVRGSGGRRGRVPQTLSPWQRRLIRRLVGWLARRLERSAGSMHDRDRIHARLLRRIEADMTASAASGTAADRSDGGHPSSPRPEPAPETMPPGAARRRHLRVVK